MNAAARKLITSLAAAALFSALVGSAMTYAAWQHNPQGEFHEPGIIHYDTLLLVFGSWFLVTMGFASVLIIGWMLVESRAQRRE